ncbi:MAG: hypothetical protein LBU18_03445 [Treponema sp.]|nr:hypothetical protein [Treponema sp.]
MTFLHLKPKSGKASDYNTALSACSIIMAVLHNNERPDAGCLYMQEAESGNGVEQYSIFLPSKR